MEEVAKRIHRARDNSRDYIIISVNVSESSDGVVLIE